MLKTGEGTAGTSVGAGSGTCGVGAGEHASHTSHGADRIGRNAMRALYPMWGLVVGCGAPSPVAPGKVCAVNCRNGTVLQPESALSSWGSLLRECARVSVASSMRARASSAAPRYGAAESSAVRCSRSAAHLSHIAFSSVSAVSYFAMSFPCMYGCGSRSPVDVTTSAQVDASKH